MTRTCSRRSRAQRFTIADDTVAEVHAGPAGELVVHARAPGTTRLLVCTGGALPVARLVVVHPHVAWEDPEDVPAPPDRPLPDLSERH